jgi:hypothetical protein
VACQHRHQCMLVYHSDTRDGPRVVSHLYATNGPRAACQNRFYHSYATAGLRVACRRSFATHMPPVSVGLPLRCHLWSESCLPTLVFNSYTTSSPRVASQYWLAKHMPTVSGSLPLIWGCWSDSGSPMSLCHSRDIGGLTVAC